MNKLREEVLLKIEEMGLLLSKEVRDRVCDERQLRKQSLADCEAKLNLLVNRVSQNQSVLTTKVSKRVTTLGKSLELTEKGWKQGIGSVANVVRSMQPALDQEIQGRQSSEKSLHQKMEHSLTAIATELEAVTRRSFEEIEEVSQKYENLKAMHEEKVTALSRRTEHLEVALSAEMRVEFEKHLAQQRTYFEQRLEEERSKRGELEKQMLLNEGKRDGGMEKLLHRVDRLDLRFEKNEEHLTNQVACLERKNMERITDMERQELKTADRIRSSITDIRTLLGEEYLNRNDICKQNEHLQSEIHEKSEWLERTERELSHRLDQEATSRRVDGKQMEVWVSTKLNALSSEVAILKEVIAEQDMLKERTKDLVESGAVAKKQIRDLWTQLDSMRSDYTDFAAEQKMVIGFLDTQQKTKFSILQKDVSNLLTLFGSG